MSQGQAAFYLQIPANYCRSFGGLRWAQYGEAVEFLEGPAAGRTFAFAAEIAVFLEGIMDSEGTLPGFGFVLHLLYLIGLGDRATRLGEGGAPCVERIAAPFRALGCPLRNAGALCSRLSREAPQAADPPDVADLHEILTGGSWVPQMVLSHSSLGVMDQAEEPGLVSSEFQHLVRRAADALTDGEIRHWLRHGCAPVGTTSDWLLPFRPRSLAETLVDLERRPRLAGIGRMVSRLDGSLALPPRRLAWPELQDGGYADITTRGAPEQILPIQFALEGEEFLRRFAERELLYFHREEPRQPTTEEIVLVLDQGVRTWGDVRLVLTGAVIALARQADRRKIAIKLAATSNEGEAVDPAGLDPAALSALLEASDLSPHPGHALARLVDSPAAARRDFVLLTHPRSLGDPNVVAAARALVDGQDARLFAVTVDSGGKLELIELRHGLPIVLARSRINLAEEGPSASHAVARPGRAPRAPWTGSFESIGFPFRTGVLDHLEANWHPASSGFDFDEEGERILVVGRHGLPFSCRIDGSDGETLSRPRLDNDVVTLRRSVVGVAGGFVVEGLRGQRRVLAHYDFRSRSSTLHEIVDSQNSLTWLYFRDLHTVVGLPASRGRRSVAVDLGESADRAATSARASRAAERADREIMPYPLTVSPVWTNSADFGLDLTCRGLMLDSTTGTLHINKQFESPEQLLTPLVDGRPALKGGAIVRALQGGGVVAINVSGADASGLYFLSVSQMIVLGTIPLLERRGTSNLALARDGRRFARLGEDERLEVRDVPGDHPPLLVAPRESLWIHFATLGRSCLLVREFDLGGPRHARSSCLIRWDQGRLDVAFHEASMWQERLGGTVAVSRSVPTGNKGRGYDSDRFVQIVEHDGLRILIDRYNHIVVLGRGGELVCMFFVSGNEVSAWLPDGTLWGARRLISGESAPGASERIAAALVRATGHEGRSS
jgi:hypothetical protein